MMKTQKNNHLSIILIYGTLSFLALLWTIPTVGLLVTSFRHPDDIASSGWWTTLAQADFGKFTLNNYKIVLGVGLDDPSLQISKGSDNIQLGQSILNSLITTIPSTVIPILLAAYAAYAFAWMKFPGRKTLFTFVVALLVVPLQIALIPILRDYGTFGLNGTFLGLWLANTGFGLALATYLLYNFIVELPKDIFESAFIDGASHYVVFYRLVVPLSLPAFASFAIFQFLWVWNGVLVPLIFLGQRKELEVLPQRILNMLGTYGNDWHLLTAGAFVSMVIPISIFLVFQRYFVRGMLAGSVKG
jgi:alpha-glucoside transport system permease protein